MTEFIYTRIWNTDNQEILSRKQILKSLAKFSQVPEEFLGKVERKARASGKETVKVGLWQLMVSKE